jgi:hypothetical protein
VCFAGAVFLLIRHFGDLSGLWFLFLSCMALGIFSRAIAKWARRHASALEQKKASADKC